MLDLNQRAKIVYLYLNEFKNVTFKKTEKIVEKANELKINISCKGAREIYKKLCLTGYFLFLKLDILFKLSQLYTF